MSLDLTRDVLVRDWAKAVNKVATDPSMAWFYACGGTLPPEFTERSILRLQRIRDRLENDPDPEASPRPSVEEIYGSVVETTKALRALRSWTQGQKSSGKPAVRALLQGKEAVGDLCEALTHLLRGWLTQRRKEAKDKPIDKEIRSTQKLTDNFEAALAKCEQAWEALDLTECASDDAASTLPTANPDSEVIDLTHTSSEDDRAADLALMGKPEARLNDDRSGTKLARVKPGTDHHHTTDNRTYGARIIQRSDTTSKDDDKEQRRHEPGAGLCPPDTGAAPRQPGVDSFFIARKPGTTASWRPGLGVDRFVLHQRQTKEMKADDNVWEDGE